MARISSYPKDALIQNKDAWIGTDSLTRTTKQYTAQKLADYLNISAKISISGQMTFRFIGNTPGIGDFSGPVNGSAIAAITTIQLSTKDSSGQDVIAFIEYLVGSNILISDQKDISAFGNFTITNYTVNTVGIYTLNLVNIGGNGNLVEGLLYDFAVFSLSSQGSSTFEFTQGVPSTVWNINHNLGKFPSISVIDTGNTIVTGEYIYTNNNNVVLNFSAAFAGKAYLN